MAAQNKDLTAPPINTEMYKGKLLSVPWLQWFNDLYYRISTKNFQNITAANAVNLDARHVTLTSSGAGYAITLDAPTVPGLFKTIQKVSNNADNITMLLTNVIGQPSGTTVTWNSQNDVIVLVSLSNSKWYIVSDNGVTFS